MSGALRNSRMLEVDSLWTITKQRSDSASITSTDGTEHLLRYDKLTMRPELRQLGRSYNPELALLYNIFAAAVDHRTPVTEQVSTMRSAGRAFTAEAAKIWKNGADTTVIEQEITRATSFANYVLREELNGLNREIRSRAHNGVYYYLGVMAAPGEYRAARLNQFVVDKQLGSEPCAPLSVVVDQQGNRGRLPGRPVERALYETAPESWASA